jgi:hypothetical protein
MCGLSLTALFQSRSGTLPMLFLITRTPCDAGEFETTGISHSSSSAIFQTFLGQPRALRVGDAERAAVGGHQLAIREGGCLPLAPALEYQTP